VGGDGDECANQVPTRYVRRSYSGLGEGWGKYLRPRRTRKVAAMTGAKKNPKEKKLSEESQKWDGRKSYCKGPSPYRSLF